MRHPPVPAEPLFAAEQIALQLGCSVREVRRLIKSGELPVIRIGRLVRIHPDDLRRFIAARRNA
jgi:excisionase family DNA binding protein